MSFAARCGADTTARQQAVAQVLALVAASGVQQIRLSWCDQHGQLRGKTVMASALAEAFANGIGMVSTILLKDSSDRTVYKVFDAGGVAELPGFEAASNLVLLPDPESFKILPWAAQTAWLRCQAWFQTGEPVQLDTRRVLQAALQKLQQAGFIRYARGHISVLDRKGLERRTCECYAVVKKEYERLLPTGVKPA